MGGQLVGIPNRYLSLVISSLRKKIHNKNRKGDTQVVGFVQNNFPAKKICKFSRVNTTCLHRSGNKFHGELCIRKNGYLKNPV